MASFLVAGIFPIIFMVEKCVRTFWYLELKNLHLFKGSLICFCSFFCNLDLAENVKNEPNHNGDHLKFSKINFFQIKMCTFFHHKNYRENAWHQKWSHISSLKRPNPSWTACRNVSNVNLRLRFLMSSKSPWYLGLMRQAKPDELAQCWIHIEYNCLHKYYFTILLFWLSVWVCLKSFYSE